jgi:outer membrane protein assembly factor BamD (BamD/ComL family)
MSLLERAQRSLATSPGTALALADEHAARFPGSALSQEREVIAISALVAVGRREDAQRRADRFRAAHPGSAYLRRIDVLLAR